MHGDHHALSSLLVLVAGSVLMPIIAGRLRLPSAILLILYGFLVGPHLGHLIAVDELVAFLAELGFMVLMFLAGLEIDFNGIRQKGARSLAVNVAICLLVFGLAFLASTALGHHPLYGLALGATSVGLPLAVLSETGRIKSTAGQAVMLVGSLGEFLTVLGMTLFYFAYRYGFSVELAVGLGKLFAVLFAMGLALRLLMALAWWNPLRFSRLMEQHDGAEIGVRASLLLMLVFSLGAVLAGVEAIVGAFIAGSVVAFVFRGKAVLEEKIAAVGHGLFVPIFFIVVGVRFDPAAVTFSNLLFAAKLLLAALAVKLIPALFLVRTGLTIRESLSVGMLLAAPLTLVVAIAAIGVDLQIIGSSEQGALIVLAIASGILCPILFKALGSKTTEP